MTRTRVGWAALAAFVALLLLVARLGTGGERLDAVAPDASPALADPGPPEPEVEPSGQRPPIARDEVDTRPPPAADPSPEPPEPALALRGRVIVVDVDGRELADLDGRFRFFLWRGETADERDVRFTAGAWSVEIPEPEAVSGLSTDRVVIGARVAKVTDPSSRVDVPASGELVLRARFAPALVLEVLDASSGAHLRGISLVRALPYAPRSESHPGLELSDRLVGDALDSPIALDSLASNLGRWDQAPILVGASGYAWARVELDLALGGTRRVELEGGADLSVVVRGADPRAHARLRLRAEGPEGPLPPLMDTPLDADGPYEIGGLPPGLLRVRAELGEWIGDPTVLAEASVELVAGERRQVEILLQDPPALDLARAAGVVHVPRAWALERASVLLDLLDTPLEGRGGHSTVDAERGEPSRQGFDSFRWSRADLQVGRYELALLDPPYGIVVDLPRGGRDDLELVVPPPADLVVHVVDDATGEPVATSDLRWNPRGPEGSRNDRFEVARPGPQPGDFLIRAPAAAVELRLWLDEYLPYGAEVDLSAGVREHTVRLQRAGGILITLRSGDTPLPIPATWSAEPRALTGTGETSSTSFGTTSRRFVVTEPGTYELEPPEIPGYRKPPRQRIEVFAGRATEHVIELEPEHP